MGPLGHAETGGTFQTTTEILTTSDEEALERSDCDADPDGREYGNWRFSVFSESGEERQTLGLEDKRKGVVESVDCWNMETGRGRRRLGRFRRLGRMRRMGTRGRTRETVPDRKQTMLQTLDLTNQQCSPLHAPTLSICHTECTLLDHIDPCHRASLKTAEITSQSSQTSAHIPNRSFTSGQPSHEHPFSLTAAYLDRSHHFLRHHADAENRPRCCEKVFGPL